MFIAIKFIETNCLSLCFWLVPFRGKTQLKPHPNWYLLGVQLKFPDEHLRPFYMGGSHSLTSVTRKGDPPVCTMRQLAQTSFSGSTKASSKADRGMTVLIPLLILRKKNPFLILNNNKDKKINSLSKYCISVPKFRVGICPHPPSCLRPWQRGFF